MGSGVLVPMGGARADAARYDVLRALNKNISAALPWIDFSSPPSLGGMVSQLGQVRTLIFGAVKKSILDSARKHSLAEVTPVPIELALSNNLASRQLQDGARDTALKNCLFCQAFLRLRTAGREAWLVNEHVFVFNPTLDDTSAVIDIPSAYKLCFSLFAKELNSSVLPLFIPLPLFGGKEGGAASGPPPVEWAPNPLATEPVHLEMFTFLGKLMGSAIRTGLAFPISMTSLVWKRLVGETVTLEDLQLIAPSQMRAVQYLRDIMESGSCSESEFNATLKESFTTVSSDGRLIDLVPRGSYRSVAFDSVSEYCDACEHYFRHETDDQINAIRNGLFSVLPQHPLLVLTGRQIQRLVHGEGLVAADVNQDLRWIVKVVYNVGAKVRSGLELSSDEVHLADFGSTIEVFERRINADSIPRLRTQRGWMSQMLNPASGATGPVAEVCLPSYRLRTPLCGMHLSILDAYLL